ncbi:hypothetical protein KIH23_06130 [Flavobacterium sp. CYK-55]|uniref:DUF6155 family protein n=1 Tax=Flavobacterium sp. CYK-55 TaxID=2835529 RepID=UPI001BCC9C50|nr:DUF6155 family protein [Flavobacterium sp. CYK-55]MBS7786867.1 hypothetical protein [Flavobacterium sp. CYK-55]
MSKRELKKYLEQLSNEHLQEQIIELYEKFPLVKVYYDFVFKPNEDKLIDEAKAKILNEYFPTKRRKPKTRRSIAQKSIKHFINLGMDAFLLSDLMLFNLEVMLKYSKQKPQTSDAFYKSFLSSFGQLITYLTENGLTANYRDRVEAAVLEISRQNWPNLFAFELIMERL